MDDQAFLEELKKDFFDEANSMIQLSEEKILELENDYSNMEAVNEIFRVFHTVKGGAASLELDRIAQFTHEAENLLDAIRHKEVKMETTIFDILFDSIDILRKFIELAQNGEEPEEGYEKETHEKIVQILENPDKAPKVKKEQAEKIEKKEQKIQEIKKQDINYNLNEYDKEFILKQKSSGKNIYEIYVALNQENPMKTVSGLQIYSILKEFGDIIKSIPDIDDLLDDQFSEILGFIFSTQVEKDFIQDKIYISDVTDYIDISEFDVNIDRDAPSEQESSFDIDLTQTEKNDILNYINSGKLAYKINVIFEEENPMRSVSGVLFHSMLSQLGNVIKSNPTLEEFKQDIFFEKGAFLLVSEHDTAYIKEKLFLSDITKDMQVLKFKEKDDLETASGGQQTTTKSTQPPEPAEALAEEIEEAKPASTAVTKKQNVFTKPQEPVNNTPPSQVTQSVEPPQQQQQSPKSNAKTTQPSGGGGSNSSKSSILRVESRRVDDLLNLVGELVISKASFFQVNDKIAEILDDFIDSVTSLKKDIKQINSTITSEETDLQSEEAQEALKENMLRIYSSLEKITPNFKKTEDLLRSTTQSFGRLTNDLHESVMKLRMVPINQIFNRFPRLVRDLSKTLNKEINLITKGEDTELDKSLIEDLIDPLIHIVRNAVDHGIEAPEERAKSGKDKEGTLILEAEHEGQMISIKIKDDGKGLNKDKIRKKALDSGLIDSKMEVSDTEIYNLIFNPGFSTSDQISQVSGRGVGMDVVKQKVDSLNGTISIETIQGKGTTFTIKLPLTLAIIQALMVEVADLVYSIPINSVIETIRITPDEVEYLENNEIIRVRDEVVSLVHLKEVFNHGDRENTENFYVIIVGTSESKIGLVVDGLIGEQDVVIKPLSNKFAASDGIAGATILGDGRVSLIIDIPALIKSILEKR